MHLFISHCTKDGTLKANELDAEAERAGRTCWIAPRDVRVGTPYPGQIVAAIEKAVGVVLLLTPGANQSMDVLQEIQCASSSHKIIAPVVVDKTVPASDLRFYLGVRHQVAWVDAVSTVVELERTFALGVRSEKAIDSSPRDRWLGEAALKGADGLPGLGASFVAARIRARRGEQT